MCKTTKLLDKTINDIHLTFVVMLFVCHDRFTFAKGKDYYFSSLPITTIFCILYFVGMCGAVDKGTPFLCI